MVLPYREGPESEVLRTQILLEVLNRGSPQHVLLTPSVSVGEREMEAVTERPGSQTMIAMEGQAATLRWGKDTEERDAFTSPVGEMPQQKMLLKYEDLSSDPQHQ